MPEPLWLEIRKEADVRPTKTRRRQALVLVFVAVAVLVGVTFSQRFLLQPPSVETARCQENLNRLRLAVEDHATNNDGLYPTDLASLVPDHLRTVPLCPLTNLRYQFESSSEPGKFTVSCKSVGHESCVVGNFWLPATR